ncbi:hypothetical protein KP509_15G064600 [Ceratopteris richardii]|nr:hypothetical protein KP509_15G064600 [Ceratopteris richardii]
MSKDRHNKKEEKRLALKILYEDVKAAKLLMKIPGRMCSNGATETCSLYVKQGCKGTNQDSMLAWENFTADKSIFLGIFDGHGPNGHIVSNKVRDCLPLLLTSPIESLLGEGFYDITPNVHEPLGSGSDTQPSILDDANDDRAKGKDDCDDEGSVLTEEKFIAAFHKMDERLKVLNRTNCMSSGTTAIAMIIQGRDFMVGSVGDSRAILATRSANGSLVAHQLTVDLKPNSPGEKERIQKCEGRVFALDNEPDVFRMWLPHSNTPGLAMSRAFGDFHLKDYGLIATPVISRRKLTDEDEFIVLATDGVWDVLSHMEVIDAICSSPLKEEAAKRVVDAAANAWRTQHWPSRMDDCAVVCHFLKNELIPPSTSILKSNVSGKLDTMNLEDSTFGGPIRASQPLVRYDTFAISHLDFEIPQLCQGKGV